MKENKIIESIYPNPINSNTIIHLNNKNVTIDICDINGKIICKKEHVEKTLKIGDILTQKLPKGIYVLRILKNNKAIDSKRFIITN